MHTNKLITYVRENQSELIRDLEQLVAIESLSHQIDHVKKALTFVLDLGNRLGFHSYSLLDDAVGIVEVGQGDETIGILVHVDVVDPGNLDLWKTPPFQLTQQEGKLFGRGTMDDKGPVIASLYAMKALTSLSIPLKKKIQLIIGTQEEVQWTDMDAYTQNYPLPDYGFTPDGEFPLCNIEKGVMDILMEFPILLSKEYPQITHIKAGTAKNILPGTAIATVKYSEFGDTQEIEFQGKSVHSCQPEFGKNALVIMAKEMKSKEVDLKENSFTKILAMIREYFSDPDGHKLGLASSSDYYQGEFVHRNVFTPTLLYVENGRIFLNINIRFAYGADESLILQGFEKLAQENHGKIRQHISLPAVFVSQDKEFLTILADSYEEITGLKNSFSLAYGGSYAKAMPNIVSWGPIFPGEEDTCHCENEYIFLESLLKNTEIFALALSKLALTNRSFK